MDASLGNLLNLVRLGQDKKSLSQVLMPFGETDADNFVALLAGNLQIGSGLRRDGCQVSPEDAICDLEQRLRMSCVSELSDELGRAVLEDPAAFKETEIREEWTEADNVFVSGRSARAARHAPALDRAAGNANVSALPDDIEAMLAAAEREESGGLDMGTEKRTESRMTAIKKEAHVELKDRARREKPTLRQASVPSNSLVGEIIERSTQRPELAMHPLNDETSAKVILNDAKTHDLKRSSRFKQSRRIDDTHGNK